MIKNRMYEPLIEALRNTLLADEYAKLSKQRYFAELRRMRVGDDFAPRPKTIARIKKLCKRAGIDPRDAINHPLNND